MTSIRQQSRRTQRNIQRTIRTKIPRKIERALTAIGIVVGNRALEFTPLDTSALQNSQDRYIIPSAGGWRLGITYTQNYAAALHERDDWGPRPPGSPGKPNGGWNPRAQPDWMNEADKATRGAQRSIIRGEMKL